MKLPLYIVNAFARDAFGGNPAAVCPLEGWLDEDLMQQIAAQNNLSETAFIVPDAAGYQVRWFTPAAEVPLCGHATLASAAVIRRFLAPGCERVEFQSMSGILRVSFEDELILMNLPALPGEPVQAPGNLVRGLGVTPTLVQVAEYYLAVLATEGEVAALTPDLACLATLDRKGVIVTAPGESVDFVSRFFAPRLAVDEDPVTGSAHCTLVPYWSRVLGKQRLHARQLSRRGGDLFCELLDGRVQVGGYASFYLQGEIDV